MRFELLDDPYEFRERTRALLVDEAHHNLMRGVLGTLIDRPGSYDFYRMVLVDTGSEVAAAGLMTLPYNLIVADIADERAVDVLVRGLAAAGFEIPGVIGNQPTVSSVVTAWTELTGEVAELSMAQGVFALREVTPVPPAAGSGRRAQGPDAELAVEWFTRFIDEAIPDEPHDKVRLRRNIDERLRGDSSSGIWLWDVDGEAVALSGHGNPTGSGIRIGPVYTPPEHRGNGYATSLVAEHSQWLLTNGYDFCFLFTDLANPTSNRIYERIGYRRVGDSASYRFFPASHAV